VADAILYQSNFNRYSGSHAVRKCVAQFPQAFEMEAQMGTSLRMTIPGLSLVWSTASKRRAPRAGTVHHHCRSACQGPDAPPHENVDGTCRTLAVCPALRNRSMDAVIVYQGGTHFGFITKEQISLFKTRTARMPSAPWPALSIPGPAPTTCIPLRS